MAKIIHAADLHIKESEKQYCFAVLDEILALARSEKAAYLLFCGDLFDSFEDMKALKDEFRGKLTAFCGASVLYLSGNHEDLRRGENESLENYDLGPVVKCYGKPYSLVGGDEVEFVCVPHQEAYAGYRDWGVPPKAAGKARLLLLHGTDSSVYTGPETEEVKAGIIDEDMFALFEADYAAMGHIHGKAERRAGACLACYSGSARVWRAGEAGPRGVILLEAAGGAVKVLGFKELKSAGQYRAFSLPLGVEGGIEAAELQAAAADCGPADLLEIAVFGVVEDENSAATAEAEIRAALEGKVRQLRIERGEVLVASGLAGHPAAKSFLEKWRARRPEAPERVKAWLLARSIGLKAIAGALDD